MEAFKSSQLADLFGGVRPFARKMGLSPSTVTKWKERGGRVPTIYNQRIRELAVEHGYRQQDVMRLLDPVCPHCGQAMPHRH